MASLKTPQIVSVDRLSDGLCIYFADGRNSFYPSTLLYSALDLAAALANGQGRDRFLVDEGTIQ
jgi:hypothetical protein